MNLCDWGKSMYALNFYIKERKPFLCLYGVCLCIGIVLLVFDIYRLSIGEVNKTLIRFLVHSIFLVPALIIYWLDFKKFLLVCKDYKFQELETKELFLRNTSYKKCIDKFNGAYLILYCSEKQGEKVSEYWHYRRDLLYDDVINGRKYEVKYYKNSKCVYSIKPLFQESVKKNKTTKKKLKKENNKPNLVSNQTSTTKSLILIFILLLFSLPVSILILIKVWSLSDLLHNFGVLFFIISFAILFINFYLCYKHIQKIINRKQEYVLIKDRITVRGIPVEKEFSNPHRQGFYLKTISDSGKKLDLFFFSTDLLCLGDLKERQGYKGYGNFIGAKYEVEYYKVSRFIKSMKLISLPTQSD